MSFLKIREGRLIRAESVRQAAVDPNDTTKIQLTTDWGSETVAYSSTEAATDALSNLGPIIDISRGRI